jgi:hypothetical protein
VLKPHTMKMQKGKKCGQMRQTFLDGKSRMYPPTRRMGGPKGRCGGDDQGKKKACLCRKLNSGRPAFNPLLSRAHTVNPKHTFYTNTSTTCHAFHSNETTLLQVARRPTVLTKQRIPNLILFRMRRFVNYSSQQSPQSTLLLTTCLNTSTNIRTFTCQGWW